MVPDEVLVSALHKRGVSLNRARRACVATGNTSIEAALAWSVEHAGDPAMDYPLPPPRTRGSPHDNSHKALGDRVNGEGVSDAGVIDATGYNRLVANDGCGGSNAIGRVEGHEAARSLQLTASQALEVYVRARLALIPSVSESGDSRAGHGVERASAGADEAGELVSVLSSFRKRASLGEAQERARKLLLPGVDMAMFSDDVYYRQVMQGHLFRRGMEAEAC